MVSQNIEYKDTPLKDKPKTHGWSEDAIIDGEILYRMYYDNNDSNVYVHDLINNQYYILKDGAKHRGYILIFKLSNLGNGVIRY